MTTPRLTKPLAFAAFGLLAVACGTPQNNEEAALIPQDEARQPGNDGGFVERDILEDDLTTTTVGGVNSYTGTEDEDSDVYDATVGGTEDNINFGGRQNRDVNDPVTPNAPLADGTAGQPGQAAARPAESSRSRLGDVIPGTGAENGADRPYGNNEMSPSHNIENPRVTLGDLKEYVDADLATNLPVLAPDGDAGAYVGRFYGDDRVSNSDGPRNAPVAAMQDDNNVISLYSPAMSDVAAASYLNTKTKLYPKVGAQNFVHYQPTQLEFTPLISWNSARTTAKASDSKLSDSAPRLGADCGNAEDVAACSSEAFAAQFDVIINDPRVRRSIALDRVDAFRFELDARGEVAPGSIVVMSDGQPCSTPACNRLRQLMAGVILRQEWSAAVHGGVPVGSRVMVPLRYGMGTNKNLLE